MEKLLTGFDPGTLLGPSGLTMKDGHLYVADFLRERILKFTSEGEFLEEWKAERAVSVAVDRDGHIYWSDQENDCIQKFKPGEAPVRLDIRGGEVEQSQEPLGLAVDSDGFLYVANWNNPRIQKLNPDGALVAEIGESGTGPGQLVYPGGVCVGKSGRIYVTDTGNHRVQIFKKG